MGGGCVAIRGAPSSGTREAARRRSHLIHARSIREVGLRWRMGTGGAGSGRRKGEEKGLCSLLREKSRWRSKGSDGKETRRTAEADGRSRCPLEQGCLLVSDECIVFSFFSSPSSPFPFLAVALSVPLRFCTVRSAYRDVLCSMALHCTLYCAVLFSPLSKFHLSKSLSSFSFSSLSPLSSTAPRPLLACASDWRSFGF